MKLISDLMEHDSKVFDQLFQSQCSVFKIPYDQPQILQNQEVLNKSIIEHSRKAQHCGEKSEKIYERKNQQGEKERLPEKSKRIRKSKIPPSEAESKEQRSQYTFSRRRKPKKNKTTYPTNNLLPTFKAPHIQFLKKYIDIKNCQLLQNIIQKNGINMEDFENLYKTKEFQHIFKLMFQSKFLYQHLLLSRSTAQNKKTFQRKIGIFEEAFRAKSFTKIN